MPLIRVEGSNPPAGSMVSISYMNVTQLFLLASVSLILALTFSFGRVGADVSVVSDSAGIGIVRISQN